MEIENNKTLHLLVRFSDNLFSTGDAMAHHLDVIKLHGSVWFGKLGAPIAQRHIDIINAQCQKNLSSYLYLVKGNRKKSMFYKCNIVALSSKKPNNEREKIPSYYFEKKLVSKIKLWAKISNIIPIDNQDLKAIRVTSSVNSIQETVARSSSGHFLVCEITQEITGI